MNSAQKSHVVRYRTVTITVYPVSKPGGYVHWQFRHGKKKVTRASLAKAKAEASKICEETFLGAGRVGALDGLVADRIRRILAVDPRLDMVDEFLVWHSKAKPKKSCKTAIAEFLAAKKANAGKSVYNVQNLTKHLSRLPDLDLSEITPELLPAITGSPRTIKNVIGAWTTFFRWCKKQGYLPYAEPTAPELLDRPSVPKSVPVTLTRSELDILLANVSAKYKPWLVLGAWAGLRTEEICPDSKSGKDGLRWEDFHWNRSLIEIRPEVAKTATRRWVPILPCLRAVLDPIRGEGLVGPSLPPHTPQKGGEEAETTRIGKFIGGWKRNALRHSFISFYAAKHGMEKAAMAAGNSESESRRSYHDAKGEDEADEWFAVPPVLTKS